ncbi:MAG: hypothetical protein KC457_11620, partial [Myxococcales bacterium]|nr:hypothetical protein [Myxococcales bacterium]
ALDGERPFADDSVEVLLESVEGKPRGGRKIDAGLRQVLRRGLALRPEDRHESLEVVLAAITALRERPGRRRRAVTMTVLGSVTVASLIYAFSGEPKPVESCEPAERLAALRDDDAWPAFDEAMAGRAEVVRRGLVRDAELACSRKDDARMQQVSGLHDRLVAVMRTGAENDHRAELLGEIARARGDRPLQLLSPATAEYIDSVVTPIETQWELEEWEVALDRGLDEVAETAIDRSELLLRRGRVRALRGDYDEAMADFRSARDVAMAQNDADRVIQAYLALAKLSIIRLGDFEFGKEWLDTIDPLLTGRGESWLSVRRTEALEIEAFLERNLEHPELALLRQLRAVSRRCWHLYRGESGRNELATSLVSLGNIYMDLEDYARSRLALEQARQLVQDDHEVTHAYALLLYVSDADEKEIRPLLEELLRAPDHDLHLITQALLLSLDADAENLEATRVGAERLEAMLDDASQPRTKQQEEEARELLRQARELLAQPDSPPDSNSPSIPTPTPTPTP